MNWKITLASAAFAVSALVPSVALADGPHIGVSVNLPPMGVHVHSSACHHDHDELPPQPPNGVPQQTGRYELQTVNQWVPGRYEQVFVQGQCFTKYKKHRTKTVCTDGYYENRWVEGRYQQVQQWVWVDHRNYSRPQSQYAFGRHPATRVR